MFTSVGKNPDEQPKWLPQVMKVIEVAEANQPFVKEFIDYSRAGAPKTKDLPQENSANAEAMVEASGASTPQ